MSADRAFEIAVNELRKNIRMNLAILRGLLGAQLAVIIVLSVMTTPNDPDGIARLSLADYEPIITLSFAVYLLWPVIVYIFRQRSRRRFRERTRRGAVLIDAEELQRRLPEGTLSLSEHITLPHGFETTHVFIGGATGSGKTQSISRVITELRARRAKAVIYDAKDGEFVAKFYRPETDRIFNPFDARSTSSAPNRTSIPWPHRCCPPTRPEISSLPRLPGMSSRAS